MVFNSNILEVSGTIMNHSDDFLNIILRGSDQLFCNMMQTKPFGKCISKS